MEGEDDVVIEKEIDGTAMEEDVDIVAIEEMSNRGLLEGQECNLSIAFKRLFLICSSNDRNLW